MSFSKLDWQETILRGAGKDLTHAQMRVLMTMSTYASSKDGGQIHPGRKRIVEDIGCNKKTVVDAIAVLVERGYLKLVEQGGNQVRRGWANTYQLTYPKWVLDGNTRAPLTGSLNDPQGAQSVPQGAQSLDTRDPLTGSQGAQSLGPHPVIDPGIHPVIESFTSNSDELPAQDSNVVELKDIPADRYKYLLGWIQKSAKVTAASKTKTISQEQALEQGLEADDCVAGFIEELFGEDYAEYFASEWSIPAKAADRYQAGAWLKKFLHSCKEHGRTCYPAGSEEPRELKVS